MAFIIKINGITVHLFIQLFVHLDSHQYGSPEGQGRQNKKRKSKSFFFQCVKQSEK